MLCKAVLSFESVDEVVKGDRSVERFYVVLSCITFIILYKVFLTVEEV